MEALGKHYILEYYGCPTDVMNNLELIENSMTGAARKMGATIVASEFHQFNPFGISGMVIISESHLSIHTWPEFGYAAVDVFTCGDIIDARVALDLLREAFQSTSEEVQFIPRGTRVPANEIPKAYDIKSAPAE